MARKGGKIQPTRLMMDWRGDEGQNELWINDTQVFLLSISGWMVVLGFEMGLKGPSWDGRGLVKNQDFYFGHNREAKNHCKQAWLVLFL